MSNPLNREPEFETHQTEVQQELLAINDIDSSDQITVIENNKTLMFLIRKLGIELYNKGWRNLDAVEKFFAQICLNSIVDFGDNTLMKAVGLDGRALNDLKKRYITEDKSFIEAEDELKNVTTVAKKVQTIRERYNFYISLSLKYDGDIRKKLEIIASIYKTYVFKKSIGQNWEIMSQLSIIVKLWSNIFEILFEEEPGISLQWSEVNGDNSKVDLTICFTLDAQTYPLSFIEFRKNGKFASSIKENEGKVLVEGKAILNKLAKLHDYNMEQAKDLKVNVVQICGLKAVFRNVRLIGCGAYMATTWGKTVKFPITEQLFDTFTETALEQLFIFKDEIIKEAESLKRTPVQGDSESTIKRQSFLKESYYLSTETEEFPELNDDLFEACHTG